MPGIAPIDRDEIINGSEIEKGQYVLLTRAALAGRKGWGFAAQPLLPL